ncbi:MAG: LptF/LptG family permease [Pseudomonadota bacterium]
MPLRLGIYLSQVVIGRVIGAGLILIVLGLSIDLIKSATDVMAEGGAVALLSYAAFRAPQVAATTFPIAVLMGATLAFLTLGARSELTVIRGAGQSIFNILIMLIPCALALGIVYNLLTDRLAAWSEVQLNAVFPQTVDRPGVGEEIWSRSALAQPGAIMLRSEVLRARLGAEDGSRLTDLSLWQLDGEGRILRRSEAAEAVFQDGAWQLTGGDAGGGANWLTQLTPAAVMELAAGRIAVSASDAREALAGRATPTRGTAFYTTRIARSYSALIIPGVMMMLAAIAGFGLARAGGGPRNAIIGVALGLLYIAGDAIFASLGEVGAMGAIWASAAPSLFFAVVALWALLVLEE